MIQIKFLIEDKDLTIRRIQFCKNHEKNMETLYGITQEALKRNEKCEYEQIMIFCCYHISEKIRKKLVTEIIHEKLLEEFFKHQSILQMLKRIRSFSIEAKIDNFPIKILKYSSDQLNHNLIRVKQ
jgi:hypothetical protein